MKDDHIIIRLTKKEKADFKDACWWQRESMAEVLITAIKEYLKKHGRRE